MPTADDKKLSKKPTPKRASPLELEKKPHRVGKPTNSFLASNPPPKMRPR